MSIKKLIGATIDGINYKRQEDDGLQFFSAYLQVTNDRFINIPTYPDQTLEQISIGKKVFSNAKKIPKVTLKRVKRARIIEIYFQYIATEFYEGTSAILKLDNGLYLTENSCGPCGLTDIDLLVFTKSELDVSFENYEEIELKSI